MSGMQRETFDSIGLLILGLGLVLGVPSGAQERGGGRGDSQDERPPMRQRGGADDEFEQFLREMGLSDEQPSRSRPSGMPPFMQGGDSGVAISVANGAIFVLHQGKLSRFDEKTLKPEASVSITPQNPQTPAAAGGSGSSEGRNRMGPDSQREPGGMSSPGGMMRPPPMMRGGGGAAITVSDGHVYVITQGKLLKYDAKKLELLQSVELEKKDSGRDPPSDKPKKPAE